MQKIMNFDGARTLSIVESSDYSQVREMLPDNDYREIAIFTRADFDAAVKAGCKIYQKTIDWRGGSVERYFIRVKRSTLFSNAEKL